MRRTGLQGPCRSFKPVLHYARCLGCLGTVTGMIAVFDAMATQGGNARSMAAGVSMATIPTMSGMIASLSGLVGSTFLRRKVDYEIELFEDQSHPGPLVCWL